MKADKVKKGKQNVFVNHLVKEMDEETFNGENLFGEETSEELQEKIPYRVQIGNLHKDRKIFANPQDWRVISAKGCSSTLNLASSPLILIKDGNDYKVRRLTGYECMRLMGVQDEDIDKLVEGGLSNNQLSQLAGNSIVVDVMSEFYKEMIKY